ncbi:phage holin family protein [Cohnella thailandensis]|uniref:Phage holin family protein n=1 Tax=Cohnella thailandensis TaxID=557557 RepID=A0A841SQU9_9BACL|nr:phage holin family protein [Cohnella thailandensis]MBB6633572.1 phage holin family protein [Cohnella thailandensis]MBP1974591.1 phage-related holin [Cohnella thailandensis]
MQRFIKSLMSLDTLAKPMNGVIATMGAFISPIIEYVTSSGKFWAYLFFIAIVAADWLAGITAAKKTESYRSEYGQTGVLRTIFLAFIPFIGMLLDKMASTIFFIDQPGVAFYGLTLMLAYHSWESMTANCARAGWDKWIPKSVLNYVASEIKAKAERAANIKGEGKNG